jgi:hypothetical protein
MKILLTNQTMNHIIRDFPKTKQIIKIFLQFLNYAKKSQYKMVYPHIFSLKTQRIFWGIPKKIAAVINLKSIELSRGHDMVIMQKRKAYFGCKILDRIHPFKKDSERYSTLKDRTNSHLYINKIYGGCR